jgi:DNA-binding CsgD family transcriptional regulator
MTGDERPPQEAPSSSRRKRGRPPHPDILTPREWQVLDLLREGLTNEQIAQRLDISPATAKYHVSEILSKLGVETREQAAAWQPELAPARRWRAFAFAWATRRAWPLAGAAGAVGAVAVLAWIVLGASAGDDDTEGGALVGPTASPSPVRSPAATPVASPTVLGQVLTPLPDNAISEEGSYLVDLETGQIWRTDGFGVWSPDGTKMLRAACCGTGDEGLDVLDFATGNALRILGEQVYSVAWSPDSSQIAFSLFTGSDTEAIYVVAAEGGQPVKLAEVPYDGSLSWSPSENYLVLLAPPGGTGAATLVALATKETQVIPELVNDLAWSPDGSSLAYGSQNGLFVMDVKSGGTSRLVSLPTSSNILWSPDGRRLLASIDGTTQIVSLDRGAPPTVLPPGRYFTWSPDSKRVAYIGEGCVTEDWDVYVFWSMMARRLS